MDIGIVLLHTDACTNGPTCTQACEQLNSYLQRFKVELMHYNKSR